MRATGISCVILVLLGVQTTAENPDGAQQRRTLTNQFDIHGMGRETYWTDAQNTDQASCADHQDALKAIQCWTSQFSQGLVTREEMTMGLAKGVAQLDKEHPTLPRLTGLWYSSKQHSLSVGRITPLRQDPWLEVNLPFGYSSDHRYIAHIRPTNRPALVYSIHGLKGKPPPEPVAEFFAVDGTAGARVMYVQDGESQALVNASSCSDFDRLPKTLEKRKHVSIVLRGAGICHDEERIKAYDRFIGEYEEMQDPHSKHKYFKPIWECNVGLRICGGKGWKDEENHKKMEKYLNFLA